MAVTYTSSLKTYRMQEVVDQVDTKNTFVASTATGAAGQLIIGTGALAGGTVGVLVTVPLSLPSFTVSASTITLAGVPITVTNPAASGTAALAEFRTGSSIVIISGLTVSTGTGNIVVNTTTVSTGIPFQVTSGTITHA